MPYSDKNTGELRYSLKEKVEYHNKCANSGKTPNGEKLTFSQRVNHNKAAARCTRKLSNYANAKTMVNRSF